MFHLSNILIFYFIDSQYTPLILISDLKESIKENNLLAREPKIAKLKWFINNIVDERQWDLDDIFKEQDLTVSITFECVIYYLAG